MRLAALALIAAAPAAAEPAAVLRAERAIADAQLAKDPAAYGALLAPGYRLTLPNGEVVAREKLLEDLRTWWRPVEITLSAQQVRIAGDAAVVHGRARYAWLNQAKVREEAVEQYTDTYVRAGGRWLRFASHAACISGRCT